MRLKYQTFHPALWPKMIDSVAGHAEPGDLVEVFDKEGRRFGWGIWNPKARLPLRMVQHGEADCDESFFARAIAHAATLRRQWLNLDAVTETYRCIHGDADFLPGLVVDRFGPVLSLEVTALGAWRRLPQWLPLLHEAFGTSREVVQIDAELGRIEGIPTRRGGEFSSQAIKSVKVQEHGVRYEINFASGHKTGFFCDQRDNRRLFRTLVQGKRVLDLCTYSGGFAINAALGGAEEVTAVDLDEAAIAMAKRNANLNQVRVKWTHADVFTWMRTMLENGRKWDVVMVDPPKFVLGRDDAKGQAKYHDLNKLALRLVADGGLYITASCSGQFPAELFERVVLAVAHRQNKRLQLFARSGAGGDHPELSNYPESRYLKVLWSRVGCHPAAGG